MNFADLPDDSDTSDEDYLPGGKPEEIPSEADSDGVSEDQLSEPEEVGKRGQKRKKQSRKSKKKAKNESQNSGTSTENEQKLDKENDDEKKKKEEDLWADFMKDTGFQSRSSASCSQPKPKVETKQIEKKPEEEKKPQVEKVKVTQIFEFAGEEVRVEKEVAADSAEARLLTKPSKSDSAPPKKAPVRGGLSGISNVLSQLGKKAKISTLEKSKLDWDRYKKEENLEEELQNYNKGKDGYLDRQDFLQRADLRRFEIEKDIRTIERNKRMNNSL